MARELTEWPQDLKVHRASKYPWDGEQGWLNGKVWSLEAGTDFTVSMDSFKMAARQAAATRNGTVRLARDGEKTLVIQFVKN